MGRYHVHVWQSGKSWVWDVYNHWGSTAASYAHPHSTRLGAWYAASTAILDLKQRDRALRKTIEKFTRTVGYSPFNPPQRTFEEQSRLYGYDARLERCSVCSRFDNLVWSHGDWYCSRCEPSE